MPQLRVIAERPVVVWVRIIKSRAYVFDRNVLFPPESGLSKQQPRSFNNGMLL
jgi:hypothetical protein